MCRKLSTLRRALTTAFTRNNGHRITDLTLIQAPIRVLTVKATRAFNATA